MTGLLSDAYAKTASISTIMNGFKRTGIWPVDCTVFSEIDFIAANALLEDGSENASEAENLLKRLLSLKPMLLSYQFTVIVLSKTKIGTQ
ncbi:unnamed protein product [Acanthoscelides obtectus]|uniref:Uncharacterized protein n=1 Tax=Acanthoscelides obtectus TaxID=200917 RepID=A0A9P0KG17_ACAOB|nr:unnamed protein product [Acanthoscelides obtectus]CAK1628085.1 hypothetical protein AOBTE_LOCUS5017 [Acanthoscelides obtectus]